MHVSYVFVFLNLLIHMEKLISLLLENNNLSHYGNHFDRLGLDSGAVSFCSELSLISSLILFHYVSFLYFSHNQCSNLSQTRK